MNRLVDERVGGKPGTGVPLARLLASGCHAAWCRIDTMIDSEESPLNTNREQKVAEEELRAAEWIVNQRRGKVRREKRLGEVVSRLMARRGYAQIEANRRIQELWNVSVGTTLAADSRPTVLKRGVLEVAVRNSAALQQLTFTKQELLRRLKSDEMGQGIRELRFRVASFD